MTNEGNRGFNLWEQVKKVAGTRGRDKSSSVCKGRVKYPSLRKAIDLLMINKDRKHVPEICSHCGYWHLNESAD